MVGKTVLPPRTIAPLTALAWLLLTVFLTVMGHTASAETLEQRISSLKADVAAVSEELFELEENVLYPADTQLAVFLSVANADALTLNSVELLIDGKPATAYFYTPREQIALQSGSLQRLYLGNVPLGNHRLGVKLTAQSGNDRYVRRETEFRFLKRAGESRLQLVLDARAPDYEPEISLKTWN